MTQALTTAPREERLDGAGGLEIFVRSWRPAAKARGVVAIGKEIVMADIKGWLDTHVKGERT